MKKNRFDLLLTVLLAFCCVAFLEGILTSEAQARPRTQQAEVAEDEEVEPAPAARRSNTAVDENEAAPADAAADDEDEDTFDPNAPIPEPEKVFGARLQCKDGVQLSATFYPGNRGKKNVPVIILHDWGGTRADVAVLAQELQKNGCSVIIPDLRGHGKSIYRVIGEDKKQISLERKIDADYLETIIMFDLPCVKKFLLRKNNEGELNIDKLIVGGIGFGGFATVFFANNDWNPGVKRKKDIPLMGDVKGFFIVGPPKVKGSLKGVDFANSITFPNWMNSISCIMLTQGAKGKQICSSYESFFRKFCGKKAMERCWFKNYNGTGDEVEALQDPESDFVLDILAFVDKRGTKRDLL